MSFDFQNDSSAQDRLLVAAMQLMHARGYMSVGIAEICALAEVKRGSFFHFYPSKKALGIAVVEGHWKALDERVFRDALGDEPQSLDSIRRLFVGMFEYDQAEHDRAGFVPGCPMGVLGMELGVQDPELQSLIRRRFQQLAARIEQVLNACPPQNGQMIDAKESATSIVAYLEGIHLLARVENDVALAARMLSAELPLVFHT